MLTIIWAFRVLANAEFPTFGNHISVSGIAPDASCDVESADHKPVTTQATTCK
ncbi:hypothetical protein KKF34_08880 [Myxococcota bacterium]|nr:hypothetical protein [Myxococcota bacterium]MBU1380633.1 hypothetical protein [Myxococcota bacterium]MBU1496975.1 hypothetical protein [Myxococcota bacterium]